MIQLWNVADALWIMGAGWRPDGVYRFGGLSYNGSIPSPVFAL